MQVSSWENYLMTHLYEQKIQDLLLYRQLLASQLNIDHFIDLTHEVEPILFIICEYLIKVIIEM